MRESIFTIFISLTVFILLIVSATTAIECWSCSSVWDPKCDPFESKPSRIKDCNKEFTTGDKPTLCKKVKGYNFHEKIWYTERGCVENGHRHEAQPGCKNAKNPDTQYEETTCYCNNEYCNGSTNFGLNKFIFVLSLGVARFVCGSY